MDIHRKPGYDPVELFVDPGLTAPHLKVAWTLLKKQLGFRYLMDVVPLNASLVRGSHGRVDTVSQDSPLVMVQQPDLLGTSEINATSMCDLILRHLEGCVRFQNR